MYDAQIVNMVVSFFTVPEGHFVVHHKPKQPAHNSNRAVPTTENNINLFMKTIAAGVKEFLRLFVPHLTSAPGICSLIGAAEIHFLLT